MIANVKKYLFVLLFATWILASLALAETSPSTTPSTKAAKPSKTAALAAQLISLETGTWEAAKRQDAKAFAAVCLDDCVEIYDDGTVLPIKEVLAQFPDTVIGEYKIEDIAVTFPINQTALVRYKVWAKMSYKGQETPPRWVYATAVWVEKDGAWKAAFYQETPVPKKWRCTFPRDRDRDGVIREPGREWRRDELTATRSIASGCAGADRLGRPSGCSATIASVVQASFSHSDLISFLYA